MTRLSASWTRRGNFVLAWQYGGTGTDVAYAVAVSATGGLYIAGSFSEVVDFDLSTGAHELSSAGSTDAFIVRTNLSGDLDWTWQMEAPAAS